MSKFSILTSNTIHSTGCLRTIRLITISISWRTIFGSIEPILPDFIYYYYQPSMIILYCISLGFIIKTLLIWKFIHLINFISLAILSIKFKKDFLSCQVTKFFLFKQNNAQNCYFDKNQKSCLRSLNIGCFVQKCQKNWNKFHIMDGYWLFLT